MATATRRHKPKPKEPIRQTVSLREDWRPMPSQLRIDEEAGVIYHVKMIGLESLNGRIYTIEAVKAAKPLYDGAKCFIDHPDDPKKHKPRDDADAFGKFQEFTVESDGGYGNLHYFKSHPLAARVIEDIKRGIGFFGMSHNAQGEGYTNSDGIFVVERIVEVRSVDLVSESATTANLWESKVMAKKMTVLQLVETMPDTEKAKARLKKLLSKDAKLAAHLLEEQDGGDHFDHLYNAHKACRESDPEMANKILNMMKVKHEDGDGEDGDGHTKEAAGEDLPLTPQGDEKNPGVIVKENAKEARLRALELKDAVRTLCEAEKFAPDALELQSLIGLPTDKDRKAMIAKLKGAQKPASGPRSQGAGRFISEGRNDYSEPPKDVKEFASRIFG